MRSRMRHPPATALAGVKAAVTSLSFAMLLLSGCSDVATSHYETYDQAAREGLFDRGWLPDSIPSSSHDIRVSNNLDCWIGERGPFSRSGATLPHNAERIPRGPFRCARCRRPSRTRSQSVE